MGPLEGLIVDTKLDGIGFRKHGIPSMNHFGYVWTEDLLWVQPETSYVNTNLALDFTISNSPLNDIAHLVLIELIQDYPEIQAGNPQDECNLMDHRYKVA